MVGGVWCSGGGGMVVCGAVVVYGVVIVVEVCGDGVVVM